ncbi:hypothetical protein VP249E411_P0091 [Vibrio phage 249E41-1]|nr:hypothetical protein VP249E411_P0091 [Vibrio phage 249E41-1]
MTYKTEHTPYDYIITIGTEAEYLTLSVSSKGKDTPLVALSTNNGKHATLCIPFSFFADFYESCLVSDVFVCPDLAESTSLTRIGTEWKVIQTWEGSDLVTTTVPHKDMIKLLQHCSRTIQTKRNLGKKFKKPLHKKVYIKMKELYNLPRKLINW